MKDALIVSTPALANFPLDKNIHTSRMLNREQVHALMLRDKKEGSEVSYDPSLCFVVNMAENTDQIPQLFKLLNSLKGTDYFNNFFTHFNSNEDLLNQLFINYGENTSFLDDNVPQEIEVTESIKYQFNQVKSLWNSLSTFHPTFDKDKPFTTFKTLLEKLKLGQYPVSVAIIRDVHWTGFSVHNNKVMFADSFNRSFSHYTKLNVGNIHESVKDFSVQFSYSMKEIISSLNNYNSGNMAKKVPYSMICRIRSDILENIAVSRNVGFSDALPVTDVNNILQEFVQNHLEPLILELRQHIVLNSSDSNNLFDPNSEKNHFSVLDPNNKETFSKEIYCNSFDNILEVYQKLQNILNMDIGEHTVLDYNNICQAYRDHKKNGFQGLGWDSIFDSEKSTISLDNILEAQSKEGVTKTISDYFGDGKNLKIIEAHFSQQSDGFSCGYHTVANIRMQRQALLNSIDIPIYHFNCHVSNIVHRIAKEVIDPENAPVLSVAEIKGLVDDAMKPDSKMNNSIIPFGMDTKSFMMYLVLGAILGFSATIISIQTILIISTVAVLLYALTTEDSQEPFEIDKASNKSWDSEDFGHSVYEVESIQTDVNPAQSSTNYFSKLLT